MAQTTPRNCHDHDIDLSNDICKLGEHYIAIGEHSDLWLGQSRKIPGKEKVAIKVLRSGSSSRQNFSEKLNQNLGRHGATWKKLKNRHIVPFYGISYNFGMMPALILSYYPNGNIMEYTKKQGISEEGKAALVKDIALGLSYLHDNDIIHGDLRGANVLIDDGGHAALADYGLAFILDSPEFTSIRTVGTCRWTAPEVMNPSSDNFGGESSTELSFKSDIFAFAMTIIELFSGMPPYHQKKNDSSVIFAVIAGKRPDLPQYIQGNENLSSIVQDCWQSNPAGRPSAGAICQRLDAQDAPEIPEQTSWLYGIYTTLWSWIPFRV